MRRLACIKEGVMSVGIILACIIGVLIITISTPWLQERYELKDRQIEQEQIQVLNEEESQLVIDTETLFAYKGISINDEVQLQELISILPAGNQVEDIMIDSEIGQFGIQIQYKKMQTHTSSNKNNMEQITFINSTILMSLCSDLEGIITSVYMGDDLQERLICKADLDKYFKEDIRASWLIKDFKKYSEHFLRQEAISQYIGQKYTYTTLLGKEADYFFKLNFSTSELTEVGESMPYMNEDMGEALVKEYGYRLFVEGLKYNNDYMNYYSAYRLLEFYNALDLEEVLVELAICKNRTSNEAVKLACTYVMEVLGNQSIQGPVWVTRFRENTFGGGRKVYIIKEGKIKEWGKWEVPTAMEECITSPNEAMVWCYGKNSNQAYAYVLPVENEGSYKLGKTEVRLENKDTFPEIMGWAKKQLQEKSLMTVAELNESMLVQTEWFKEAFLKLQIISNTMEKVQDLFYNPENQVLTPATVEGEEFSLAQLVYELDDLLIWQGHTHIVQGGLKIEGIRVYLDSEYITVYEYRSTEEREEEYQNLQNLIVGYTINKNIHFFEKGRLLVVYEGKEEHIIKHLAEVLKSQEKIM